MLIYDDEFSIETIAVVLSYYYAQMQLNYNEYKKAYFALFGCHNKDEELWLVDDVTIGFNEEIYGHVLSYYNSGKDYIYRNSNDKAEKNHAGIKYANYTRDYLHIIHDILYDPATYHTY
jgi:hypothetical protein